MKSSSRFPLVSSLFFFSFLHHLQLFFTPSHCLLLNVLTSPILSFLFLIPVFLSVSFCLLRSSSRCSVSEVGGVFRAGIQSWCLQFILPPPLSLAPSHSLSHTHTHTHTMRYFLTHTCIHRLTHRLSHTHTETHTHTRPQTPEFLISSHFNVLVSSRSVRWRHLLPVNASNCVY